MPYMNDRMLTELVLPSHLFMSVLLNGANDRDDPETVKCVSLLSQAAHAPVLHLTATEQQKIFRRSQRTYHVVAAPYSGEGHSVAKFGLIVFYWLQELIEAGAIEFGDGPFRAAMEILLPALEPWANVADLDRSANKQVRKFHALVQGEGYFREVTL